MKFIAITVLFASALAAPADMAARDAASVCPGFLYSNLQCCKPDVLGVACLDGAVPNRLPQDGKDFQSICAEQGRAAKCCVLPVAGQDVLCTSPVGAN